MKFLSVASGIEAASCAWEPLGWRAAAFSEISAFACAVLKHRFPHVPNLGDMTRYDGWPQLAIDLLCGGTPCQSYSVAGLRAGLDSPNGDLMLTYGAIAARYRPRWLVWENVPGVLSSNGGRDFGTFLGLLGKLGYGFAYRILDAQYFGVPQRRRRVFVVGCLGDWRAAAAVLFERYSLSGHPAPRRSQGERIAPTVTANPNSGRGGTGSELDGLIAQPFEIANCLTARMHKGMNSDVNEGQTPVIAFDTTQITSATNQSNPQPGDPCHTLARHSHAPVIAFPAELSGTQHVGADEDLSPTLRASGPTAIAFDAYNQAASDVTHTLRAGSTGGTSDLVPQTITNARVRRLTPLECERLQGFPDGWTAVPTKHRNAAAEHAEMRDYYRRTGQAVTDDEIRQLGADGPRYKAIGNSWAVPCARWIGQRIQLVDALSQSPGAQP